MKFKAWKVLILIGSPLLPAIVQATDGVCFRCEEIREYNKTHHHDYEYYEDYQKEQGVDHSNGEQKKPEATNLDLEKKG